MFRSSRGAFNGAPRLLTLLALLLPPLLWAGNFIVGRGIRDDLPPGTLAFARHLLALACLLPFCWRNLRKDAALFWQARHALARTALCGMVLFNVLLYFGLQSTEANNAVLFNSAIPLLIGALSLVLLRERLTLRQAAGLAVSTAGILTIVGRGDLQTLLHLRFSGGDLLVLAGVASFALYSIWLRDIPPALNRLSVLCAQIFIATVLMLPLALFELYSGKAPAWSWSAGAAIAYVAVGSSIVATLLYASSVRAFGANRAGLCIHLVPVFGIVLSSVLLGETVRPYHLQGTLLILAGLVICTAKLPLQAVMKGLRRRPLEP
ncbi:DMT family transporter [Comamonas endophytica]|uniref:DMT family transporter n=1 Tax=Comamonas endophytica TaxID=2949090 RepID=A0ABY6GFK9_9BURK|nr:MULTISPECIES: DMT family transporter [unclassified Acidovorax]MCD2513354.1 DMT family transporter [Acidovorax sp. D4N7]UYG53861.1 DMT family transporter [Acidovorax sp. 5MLIR]